MGEKGIVGNKDLNCDSVICSFERWLNILKKLFEFGYKVDLPSSAVSSKAGTGKAHSPR